MSWLCALGLVLVRTQAAPVEGTEFFPLVAGSSWVYSDTGGGAGGAFTDVVGEPAEVMGVMATPIVTRMGTREDGRTYYRVDAGTVTVVAFDLKKPLAAPYPILKATGKKESWTYSGESQWLGESVPLFMKATCRPVGKREVLGERRDTVEVVIEATIGAQDKTGVKSRQVSLYARGVGLFELKETTTIGDRKLERRRTLISYRPGAGS